MMCIGASMVIGGVYLLCQMGPGMVITEKTTFEGVQGNLASFFTMEFKNVTVAKASGVHVVRDIWVTPKSVDDPLVDVRVDPGLVDTRITFFPEWSAYLIPCRNLCRARHVTIWVASDAERQKWNAFIKEQQRQFLRNKGI